MRPIDADYLIDRIRYTADLGGWIGDTLLEIKKVAIKYINNAPTIDAVEVCICRDCVHYTALSDSGAWGRCNIHGGTCQEVDYCSWAERKGQIERSE